MTQLRCGSWKATGQTGSLQTHLTPNRVGRNAVWHSGAGYVLGGACGAFPRLTYLDSILKFAP
jgi:hypothetical protein